MCGIAGALAPSTAAETWPAILTAMAGAIAHRGPDDHGTWFDAAAGLGFGHRRLSILDLSPEGHQPMVSASRRHVVCYNGEIYNHGQLRRQLETEGRGRVWRGHSDTEVLAAAVDVWGVSATLLRLVGIFALAIWDRREQVLFLARDPIGVKPLYHGQFGEAFLFGSELPALRAHPAFEADIDRDALAQFLRYQYVPAPRSIYRRVNKLPPGCLLTARHANGRLQTAVTQYWSARTAFEAGLLRPLASGEEQAIGELDTLLRGAVASQMMSDVPLGAFLSGGIDSSTVVALMQAQSTRPVKTFSIGFREAAFDEAPHARAVARHLNTEHTELYVTPEEGLDVIRRLPRIYDEPFGDSSQIPTCLLSELTRRHVTVSLSGDGGDELFCGYPRYFTERALWRAIGWLPEAARTAAAGLARKLAAAFPAPGLAAPGPARRMAPRQMAVKLGKLADMLSAESRQALYGVLISHWRYPTAIVPGAFEPPTAVFAPGSWAAVPDFFHHMMYVDTVTYLPDDILVKVDRASMAVGLEARVPLLDHRVVEFAARVPTALKVRGGQGKWLLRQVLYRYVPRELVERPKMGFGVPLDTWLRGPLRDWAESLLSKERLRREGYFDPAPIGEKWTEHVSGRRDWSYLLWDVLMFQAWLEHAGTKSPE